MDDLQKKSRKTRGSSGSDAGLEPRVQGTVIAAEIEDGGAAIVTSRFEAYRERYRDFQRLSVPLTITFFCPDYEPERTRMGDKTWVEFECFADWENLSDTTSKDPSIQPLKGKLGIEYSLTGDVFGITQRALAVGDFYIKAIVPIRLNLGPPSDPKRAGSIFEGKIVKLSKGRLYGRIGSDGDRE